MPDPDDFGGYSRPIDRRAASMTSRPERCPTVSKWMVGGCADSSIAATSVLYASEAEMPVQRCLSRPLLHEREGVQILVVCIESAADTPRRHAGRPEQSANALNEVGASGLRDYDAEREDDHPGRRQWWLTAICSAMSAPYTLTRGVARVVYEINRLAASSEVRQRAGPRSNSGMSEPLRTVGVPESVVRLAPAAGGHSLVSPSPAGSTAFRSRGR